MYMYCRYWWLDWYDMTPSNAISWRGGISSHRPQGHTLCGPVSCAMLYYSTHTFSAVSKSSFSRLQLWCERTACRLTVSQFLRQLSQLTTNFIFILVFHFSLHIHCDFSFHTLYKYTYLLIYINRVFFNLSAFFPAVTPVWAESPKEKLWGTIGKVYSHPLDFTVSCLIHLRKRHKKFIHK